MYVYLYVVVCVLIYTLYMRVSSYMCTLEIELSFICGRIEDEIIRYTAERLRLQTCLNVTSVLICLSFAILFIS